MNTKKYKILEIVGAPVIFIVASFLHFAYDLSDGSALAILFSAVNESVWEHLKIFAVSFTLWTLIELLYLKPPFKKFATAKTISLYFLCLSITLFFYGYNLFTQSPILWLDITSAFVFVMLSQYISYNLVVNDNNTSDYFPLALMLLFLFYLMFFSFTLFPPKVDLFKDPVTGMYGIIRNHIDKGAIFLSEN